MRADDRPAVLILGGTTEGYALAAALAKLAGLRVVSSLAGRTASPRHPPGELRIGGFGGAAGLEAYLRAGRITAVIDATHPFAARMGWNAAEACAVAGVPLLRLERPAWTPAPGDRWDEVDDWDEAARLLANRSRRVLLALGRQELDPFAGLDDVWFLIRSVDAPNPMPPFAQAEVVLARGPFTLADEADLLRTRGIDTLVCKNSGGSGDRRQAGGGSGAGRAGGDAAAAGAAGGAGGGDGGGGGGVAGKIRKARALPWTRKGPGGPLTPFVKRGVGSRWGSLWIWGFDPLRRYPQVGGNHRTRSLLRRLVDATVCQVLAGSGRAASERESFKADADTVGWASAHQRNLQSSVPWKMMSLPPNVCRLRLRGRCLRTGKRDD